MEPNVETLLMTQDEAAAAVVIYMFSRAIRSPKGKDVFYSFLEATNTTFSWIASLEEKDSTGQPIDWYRVDIDKISCKIRTPILISLLKAELSEAVLVATGHHLKTSSRFVDGLLSISYIVSIEEDPDIQYIVQLHHHGNVISMNLLMSLISSSIDPGILPLPTVYSIPGEEQRQKISGMGKQIARFMLGLMASSVYLCMLHKEKLIFVQNMAFAFQAFWSIPLPKEHLIGELCAVQSSNYVVLTIGLDRYYNLGGLFASRVMDFVEDSMYNIPGIVEDIPVVAMHSDMGPHNVILSPTTPTDIVAIIDWEFTASAPYASLHRIIEMLFRQPASNQFGAEYAHANELCDAFWDAIPEWKKWNESEATRVFLEWFRFGLFMKVEYRLNGLDEAVKEAYWGENVRVVEGLLEKYGSAYKVF